MAIVMRKSKREKLAIAEKLAQQASLLNTVVEKEYIAPVAPATYDDVRELARERLAAIEEVKNLTVGGVAPRAKNFRPFYVPEFDGNGADTKKDTTNGTERSVKDSFNGKLNESKTVTVVYKSGGSQRTKDGEFRGKLAMISGTDTARRNKEENDSYKARKAANTITIKPKG